MENRGKRGIAPPQNPNHRLETTINRPLGLKGDENHGSRSSMQDGEPLLRAMGYVVSLHDQFGAIPPPPFLSLSPLESMRTWGAIPPPLPQELYLSDTCAAHENKAN